MEEGSPEPSAAALSDQAGLIKSTVAADKSESNNFVILVPNSEQTQNCTGIGAGARGNSGTSAAKAFLCERGYRSAASAAPPKTRVRQSAKPLWVFHCLLDWNGGAIFLVYTFEVGDFVIGFEVPNPGGNFINQIMVMTD